MRESDFLSIVCGIAYVQHYLDHCASGTRERV
jgi:hypothetical protein